MYHASEPYQFKDWVEDYFGITDPAVVMVINDRPDGVFTPETLRLVQALSDAVAGLTLIPRPIASRLPAAEVLFLRCYSVWAVAKTQIEWSNPDTNHSRSAPRRPRTQPFLAC